MFDKQIHRDEFRLRVLLTNRCNKKCSFCLNDFQPKDPKLDANILDVSECIRAYGDLMSSLGQTSIVTFSGGEPGIYPCLEIALRESKRHCDVTKLVTNGTALKSTIKKYVDCFHVGVTSVDYEVRKFIKDDEAKKFVVQIVVTENASDNSLCSLIEYYYDLDSCKVKLFSDFFANDQESLRKRINRIAKIFPKITSRFTGVQENRGKACMGCTEKCITLKALWFLPNNVLTTCPQGKLEPLKGDFDSIVRQAYELHKC